MTTPVYEVGIYTYKSPLELDGSDVIAVHDITKNETSIGVNTIGDYDGYYISTSTPTFTDTFVPKSVVGPTLANAFAANKTGSQLSQDITNTFTVENSTVLIPGFKTYAPIIAGATLTVNQIYSPVATNVSGTLTVPYSKQLTIVSATINAPIYRNVRPTIVAVLYYTQAKIEGYDKFTAWGRAGVLSEAIGSGPYGLVYPINVRPRHPYDRINAAAPCKNFNHGGVIDSFDYASYNFYLAPDNTPWYDDNFAAGNLRSARWNSAFMNVSQSMGWGKIPLNVVLNADGTLADMTFQINQSDGSIEENVEDAGGNQNMVSDEVARGVPINRGRLTVSANGSTVYLTSREEAGIRAFQQYGEDIRNRNSYVDRSDWTAVRTPTNQTLAGTRMSFIRPGEGFMPDYNVPLALAIIYSDNSIVRPSFTSTQSIVRYHDQLVTSNYGIPISKQKLNANIDIPVNITQTISEQQVQINSFANNSGIKATVLGGDVKTLASQAVMETAFNNNLQPSSLYNDFIPTNRSNFQFIDNSTSSDTLNEYYIELPSSTLSVTYKYGDDAEQTATTNLGGGGQLDILSTSANLTITNSDSNFQTFLNQVISSLNFNYTNREFAISAGSNNISSSFSGGSSSYGFSSALSTFGAIAKTKDTWSLDINYTPSVPTSGENLYLTSNNSNTFSSTTQNTFTVNFNSAGTATTSSITRPTNDQAYSVYQRYDESSLVQSWITPQNKISFPGISNTRDEALTLFGLSAAGLPANTTFNNTSLTFNVSFVGDPANVSTYTFASNSGATLVGGTPQELQYPGNALTRGFDITSYVAGLLADGTGTVDGNLVVSSFDPVTNSIAGTQIPSDFYTPSVAGSTLTIDYKWGDKYNYTQNLEVFPISLSSIQINQSNISAPSTTVTLYKKPDRQRLLLTTNPQLYFTTISSNKTGYTFTEVPVSVGQFDPAEQHHYSIYRLSDSGLISGVSDVTKLVNINDNVNRRITKTFGSAPISDSNVKVLNSIDGDVGYSFGEIVSASLGFAATGATMVNQFLQFDNTKLTDLTTSSLYLFVTPTVDYTILGPSLAAETNVYWMPKYTQYNPGVHGRYGIPTFGETLSSYPNYIVTNSSAQLASIVNQSDYYTTTPFSRFDPNTLSSDQVLGFLQKDFRYVYYNVTSDTDADSSLYALPFNFKINSDRTYSIAFANNYITLKYFNVNSAWYSSNYNMTSADYPLLNTEPLYNEFKWFTPINDANATEITEITGFKLKNNKGEVLSTFTNSVGYYDDFFVKSTFLPNLVYSNYNSLLYISPIFSSPRDIPDFVLPRFYVPPSLVINDPQLFLTVSSATDNLQTLFATTFGITLPNSGGSIQFDSENLPTYSPSTPAFTIVIPGIPETPFDIQVANGTARFVVPFLMPSTTYNNVSLRYYPYLTSSDPRLQPLSDVRIFDGISFRTPDTHAFTTTSTYSFDANNNRICRVTLVNPQLKMLVAPFTTRDISECLIVFDTQNPNILISSNGVSSYGGKVTLPATQTTMTFELKELARGLAITPVVYLKKVINAVEYTSNVQTLPVMNVPRRPNIQIDWSGSLVHRKQVDATNFDVYREFLIGDYSLPFNDTVDGKLQLLRSNTVLNYSDPTPQYITGTTAYSCGSTAISNSSPSLLLDLNNVPAGSYSTFNLCYVPHQYVPTAMTQIVVTDPTGERKDIDLRATSSVGIELSSKLLAGTGFTVQNFTGSLPNPKVSFYGPLVSSSYNTSLPFDRVNVVVNDSNELVKLIERLHTADPALILHDPTGVYVETSGADADAGVLSKIVSSRIDVQKNTGYKYYLNTFSAPSGTTMGSISLTYAPGAVYSGLELNPFYHRVIAIPTVVPIFIVYIETGSMHLTDYIQQNVALTIDACAFDGYSIEIGYPEDVNAGIAVYRDVFPSDRTSGVPTYRLDDFFSRLSQYTVYFENLAQINAWNSSLCSDYWWTSPLVRPQNSCPIQILNKATSAGPLREVIVTTNVQFMEGQPVTSPAMFYGSVTVGGFSYYAGTQTVDISSNSFPVLYNGGTLSIVDSTNKVYGTAQVDPLYSSNVTITLDKVVLTPSTRYNFFLVYTYSEANIVGSARISFQYEVPADQTDISLYTSTAAIHNLYATVEAGNTFGNLLLSQIHVPSRLTLTHLDKFNFQNSWDAGTTYAEGDIVYLNNTYYWLTDIARYVLGQSPRYGFGWRNFSATTSAVKGNYDSNVFYTKNDIVKSGNKLYKVFDSVTDVARLPAPGTLNRDTGLYAPYSENAVDHSIVIDNAFSSGSLSYLFSGLIPNSTYNLAYSLKVGDTYTSLFSLGNYATLPDILDCKGVTRDASINSNILTNMSYENSSEYFNDGFITTTTDMNTQYNFSGNTGITYESNTINESIYYYPQVVRDLGITDHTQAYNLNQDAGILNCTVHGPALTFNSAIFGVNNFKPTGLTVNANDYIGLFDGTTFVAEFQLLDSKIVSGDYAQFILPIRGLLSIREYSEFNFKYRVNNTHYYSGEPVLLPRFITPPVLVIQIFMPTGGTGATVRLSKITYSNRVLDATSLFPTTNPLNTMTITLKNLYSVTSTTNPFMTLPTISTSSRFINIPLPLINPNNYRLDFITLDYTFVDDSGVLTTLNLSGAIPTPNTSGASSFTLQI